jgi:hypothetical protein
LPDNVGTTTCSPRSLTFPELMSVKVYVTEVPACAQRVGEHQWPWIMTGCPPYQMLRRMLAARRARKRARA